MRAPSRLAALCLLGSTGVASCKAPPLPENQVAPEAATIGQPYDPASHGLGPGDLVDIRVYGQQELSSPDHGTRVDPEGYLSLPLIGPVSVGGKTAREVEAEMERLLGAYLQEPDVTISVRDSVSQKFYVFGQIRQPGAYVLDRPLNALQGLAVAGGAMPDADRQRVCLLRENEGFVEVYLFDAATPGADGLVALRPGDFLFVRQTGTGRFREQVLPYLMGIQPTVSSLLNLGLVADAIND